MRVFEILFFTNPKTYVRIFNRERLIVGGFAENLKQPLKISHLNVREIRVSDDKDLEIHVFD